MFANVNLNLWSMCVSFLNDLHNLLCKAFVKICEFLAYMVSFNF